MIDLDSLPKFPAMYSNRTFTVTYRVVSYVIAMNVYAPHVHVQFP
jgi:hypothetical protein